MDWQDVPEPLRMTAGYLFSVYGSGPFNERHIIHKRLVLARNGGGGCASAINQGVLWLPCENAPAADGRYCGSCLEGRESVDARRYDRVSGLEILPKAPEPMVWVPTESELWQQQERKRLWAVSRAEALARTLAAATVTTPVIPTVIVPPPVKPVRVPRPSRARPPAALPELGGQFSEWEWIPEQYEQAIMLHGYEQAGGVIAAIAEERRHLERALAEFFT